MRGGPCGIKAAENFSGTEASGACGWALVQERMLDFQVVRGSSTGR